MRTTSKRHCLRTGRYSETGRVYLVTIVVDNRQRLFHDWSSGRPVVQALQAAEEEGAALSLCWVLMPDHLHWLLQLQTGELSATIARFKSRSTVWANRQWQRTGRLWQKGYHDRALRKDEDLQACARYVVMNPVRSGLVSSVRHYPQWDAIWL